MGHRLCERYDAAVATAGMADMVGFSILVVFGDWRRDEMCCQRDMAVEMGARGARATFIASVGDNLNRRRGCALLCSALRKPRVRGATCI